MRVYVLFVFQKACTAVLLYCCPPLTALCQQVRVIGSGHSWNEGIMTKDVLVSLDAMQRVVEVDLDRLLVTVQAGIKLKALNERLDEVSV
jgi:FAD/FMN-containing dehydrogenase